MYTSYRQRVTDFSLLVLRRERHRCPNALRVGMSRSWCSCCILLCLLVIPLSYPWKIIYHFFILAMSNFVKMHSVIFIFGMLAEIPCGGSSSNAHAVVAAVALLPLCPCGTCSGDACCCACSLSCLVVHAAVALLPLCPCVTCSCCIAPLSQ